MDPMRNPEERPEMHEKSEELREQARQSFEGAWKKTQEGIRSMKEQASQSIESARQRLSEGARSSVQEQKDKSVSSLKRVSSAIHEAAHKLEDEGDRTLADYAHMLGSKVENAANYLDQRDPSLVLKDLEGLARRQAGLFIGGMFLTGLVVARLIKSSRTAATGLESETSGTALAPQELTPAAPPPPTSKPEKPTGTIPPSASSRFGAGLGPLET